MEKRLRCALLVLFALCMPLTEAARILTISGYSSTSPYLIWRPFMAALVERGHQVTMISTAGFLDDVEGVRHLRLPALDRLIDDMNTLGMETDFLTNKWTECSLAAALFYNMTHVILSDENVQNLLRNDSEHFDIVMMDPLHANALFGLADYFNASLVGIAIFGPSWNIDYLVGNLSPSVYEPISPMGYSQGTSLWSKCQNWIHITEEWLLERLVYLPGQVQLLRQFFGYPPARLYDLQGRFSLILINQHFSLGHVRSNVPSIIEVAGLHLQAPAATCDEELQRFLDEAEHGVIYFSMGLEILMKWLPISMRQLFVDVFRQLKQRVVWKYELESLPYKSDNIYIRAELPQRHLLAHPKVKLFITHGGLLGLIEAAYNGVPMLGLPLYFDQFANMERMRLAGVSESLDSYKLTVETLNQTINDLLENPIYRRNAKEMSRRFRDQPMSPLESAVWWTEYVLRHKGASHMRLNDGNVPFMRYYCIDKLLLVFGRFLAPGIVILLCFKLFRRPRSGR